MNLPGKMDVGKDKLRQMNCEFNPLSRCDGSVMYSQGIPMFSIGIWPEPAKTETTNFQVPQWS